MRMCGMWDVWTYRRDMSMILQNSIKMEVWEFAEASTQVRSQQQLCTGSNM